MKASGRLEVLAAGLLWSLGGVFTKSIALPPAAIAAGRSLFAALLLLPLVRRAPTRRLPVLVLSLVLYTGVVSLFIWSTKITSAANAIILQYTAPAWVFALALLRHGTRPARRDQLTLAGAMIGIAVIFFGSAPGDYRGIALSLASGVLFAGWITLAGAASDIDPVAMTCANNAATALLLLPLAVSAGVVPSARQWLSLAVMGCVQLGLPYLLFSRGVKRVSAPEASLLVLIEPVLNPVWVALAVGEVPSGATRIGGAVILATLALRYGLPLAGIGGRREPAAS